MKLHRTCAARGAFIAGALAAVTIAGQPTTVTITTSKDNTLIETATGNLSLGAAPSFYAGRVGPQGGGTARRGVIAFDVAGAVPAGATITEVSLDLVMTATVSGDQTVVLKRLLADWGEGTSTFPGGLGAPSTPGDATWLHRFWPDVFWDSPGGDFENTISASQVVGGVGWYTWESTPQLVADVQGWLDDPSSNFGWLVQGNEVLFQTVKQFSSRESSPDQQPVLSITYTLPKKCAPADFDCSGDVGVSDLLFLLANWGPCPDPDDCPADLTGSGDVGVADLLQLLSSWG